MEESMVFAKFVCGINQILGKISQEAINSWMHDGKAIPVVEPRAVRIMQAQSRTNPQMAEFQISIGPLYMENTKQEKIYIRPEMVENLGVINQDAGGSEFCLENSELFNNYRKAYINWKCELSGITSPTDNAGNMIQFPKAKH